MHIISQILFGQMSGFLFLQGLIFLVTMRINIESVNKHKYAEKLNKLVDEHMGE